jgi:flagellar FliL protein
MAKQQDKNTGQEGQGGKKSKKKLLILVGVTTVVLAAGGGLGWKMGLASKFLGGSPQSEQEKSAAAGVQRQMGPTYSLGSFIVNLSDPVRRSYLKVKAELELSSPEVSTEVDKRLPQLRDSIILLLSSKSFEEVASMEGKMRLRQEMLGKLNYHLGKGKLASIYFTEFVVQ